ncbi:hypothetical protein [Sphingomonas pokkalii]|uniref:Uncharacterized protein n=1 Tax=Sphingomonas pokkalii TaxID=2175090 RepID=A0A2U0SI31_9SPHN|nr:hypothetical protein [Sphingomonas pokkalii]PVX30984.1 hypothetical protein DD559_17970 [Sphingomonas pokkalii]
METSKSFDPYEVIGIITPGTLVALLLASEVPLFKRFVNGDGLTVGDLGLFVMVAFVLGHLIQAFGNLVEAPVWLFRGLPSSYVRNAEQRLISPAQRKILDARLVAMEGESAKLDSVPYPVFRAITARAYTRVQAAGRSARIDTFSRTYGLFRGLVAASTLALGWSIFAHRGQTTLLIVLGVMLCAAVWRMRRFGEHYARTLWLEFIDLPAATTGPAQAAPL